MVGFKKFGEEMKNIQFSEVAHAGSKRKRYSNSFPGKEGNK